MVLSSLVDHPPVSGVPVAGASVNHKLLQPLRRLEIGSLTCRIQGINIDTQIDGLLGSDSVLDLFDNAFGADGVDNTGLHNLEPAVAVVLVV